MLYLTIIDKSGEIKEKYTGSELDIKFNGKLNAGDKIKVRLDGCSYVFVRFDKTLQESLLYLPNKSFEFVIPTANEIAGGYASEAFSCEYQYIYAREAENDEIYSYRNLALNSHDLPNQTKGYPHAIANFVTREEPCFYARNAIDGNKNNQGHGAYPFNSWAGGARNDLEFVLDFGQTVEIDKLKFYLRADFTNDPEG